MFCSKCGTQLADNTRFCTNCGAQIAAPAAAASEPQAAPSYETYNAAASPAEDPVKKPKKGLSKAAKVIIVIAVLIVASGIGKAISTVFVNSTQNDNETLPVITTQGNTLFGGDDSTEAAAPETTEAAAEETDNPAYFAVLNEAYIVHFVPFFGLESESFVTTLENDIIYCLDFGYKNDTIKQWVETLYVPISGNSEEETDAVENNLRANFAAFDAYDCCTVEYNRGTSLLTVTITFNDVDTYDTYSALHELGLTETKTQLSMNETIKNFLAQGYIQK